MGFVGDMFGNKIEKKEKTKEEDYKDYINSKKWKKKRARKLQEVGERCEICNRSNWTSPLHVHHLHYDTFKKERMADLQVVCEKCHVKADKKRVREQQEKWRKKKREGAYENGLIGYVKAVTGLREDYLTEWEIEQHREDFDIFIERGQ